MNHCTRTRGLRKAQRLCYVHTDRGASVLEPAGPGAAAGLGAGSIFPASGDQHAEGWGREGWLLRQTSVLRTSRLRTTTRP